MIKTENQINKFKELDEEGKTLTESVNWWKKESIETLKKAYRFSEISDRELDNYDEEQFIEYLGTMKTLQRKIEYLDSKGRKEYDQIKDFENRVNKFFVKAAFGEND